MGNIVYVASKGKIGKACRIFVWNFKGRAEAVPSTKY
jgi:hypothetical protein